MQYLIWKKYEDKISFALTYNPDVMNYGYTFSKWLGKQEIPDGLIKLNKGFLEKIVDKEEVYCYDGNSD